MLGNPGFFKLGNKYENAFLYFTYLFIFVCIYFTINNVSKYKWYTERYNTWPPIENDTLIKSK